MVLVSGGSRSGKYDPYKRIRCQRLYGCSLKEGDCDTIDASEEDVLKLVSDLDLHKML